MVGQTSTFIFAAAAFAVVVLGCLIWVGVDRYIQNK